MTHTFTSKTVTRTFTSKIWRMVLLVWAGSFLFHPRPYLLDLVQTPATLGVMVATNLSNNISSSSVGSISFLFPVLCINYGWYCQRTQRKEQPQRSPRPSEYWALPIDIAVNCKIMTLYYPRHLYHQVDCNVLQPCCTCWQQPPNHSSPKLFVAAICTSTVTT